MKWEASSPNMPVSFKHEGFYPFLLQELPEELQADLSAIKQLLIPYTKRIYLVGGAVRDLLRRHIEGKDFPIVDLDIEVYAIEPERFDNLMLHLGAKGVGKSFFVYKYKEYIDLSLPRLESKVGQGHRGFAVELAKNEKEASIRRDFCMNALMLNVFDGKLLDFWGGVEDIQKRRIRIIDEEKFQEDSLRVLRGVQFSARFGYKIEAKSCEVMRGIDLSDLSHERIFWEFEKMFKGSFLHYGLYYLHTLGVDRKVFGFVFKTFFKTARELMRAYPHFQEHLRKFYFLYILAKNEHKPFERLLDALRTPNEYYKIFRYQKKLPKSRTDRFIAAMALRLPIMDFLGNYAQDVTIRAKKFGLWEQKFNAITPKELMAEGFYGAALGKELRRRNLEAIRRLFKGRQ